MLRLGRNRPEVDICIGEDDLQISRVHGLLTCRRQQWWLECTGRTPIRLPNAVLLHRDGDPLLLSSGYTTLTLHGSRGREHSVELYVGGSAGAPPRSRPADETEKPRRWRLSRDERLALVALGQRYLMNDPHPQPFSRQQAAAELAELDPAGRWTVRKVERLVAGVRDRLSHGGVSGLRREEVGEPVGLTLVTNLLRELTVSSSLVPSDIELLEPPVSEEAD